LNAKKGAYEKEAYTFCQISLAKDKRLVLAPSSESSVIDCIDLDNFKVTSQLKAKKLDEKMNRGMLMCLKSIDSNVCLAGYENGEMALFDLRTSNELASVGFFKGLPLMCLDYSWEKKSGVCGSSEAVLKAFTIDVELNCFQTNGDIELVNAGVNCLKIRESDSKVFATGGWDSRIRVFGLKKLKPLVVLDFHKEPVNAIDFSNQNIMACGSNDTIISFWNLYNN
jgi:WD40 repeat protein